MIKACLDSLLINVVHALEIAKEAFEELSDATAVAFNWDTLVLQENGTMILTNCTALTSFISSS